MDIKTHFDHFNINVTDLEKSIDFYNKALGMVKCGEIMPENGDFKIVYLALPDDSFRLELTWLKDKKGSYDLGDNESHLGIRVERDFDKMRVYHRSMGWVCYENPEMGIYFINDPDDYWIEILPPRKDLG